MNESSLYIIGTTILYIVGIFGMVTSTRRSVLILRISIELMLLGINRQFIIMSISRSDIAGQLVALIVLTVAAAESAIGLAILVVFYRVHGTIAIESMNVLHG